MNDRFLVTDTHPLLWYIGKRFAKLPKKVLTAFDSAKEGSGTYIMVPCAVVWEISRLMQKTNRLKADVSLEELINDNFYSKSIAVIDMQVEDVLNAHSLTFNNDPFDAIIVGTAQRIGAPLITADSDVIEAKPCSIFWD